MKLNKLSTAIVTAVLFSGLGTSAFANDNPTGEGNTNWAGHFESTKTRDQVKAELEEAREQGQLFEDGSFDYAYPRIANTGKSGTRAEVRAEAAAANAVHRDPNSDIYGG